MTNSEPDVNQEDESEVSSDTSSLNNSIIILSDDDDIAPISASSSPTQPRKIARPCPKSRKRSLDDDSDTATKCKVKKEEKLFGNEEDDEEASSSSNGIDVYGRCRLCHQRLSSVTMAPSPREDSLPSEKRALRDPRIALEGGDTDEREYFHLTDFAIFDAENHLVQLDAGLVEAGKDIFFSGVLNAVYCADPRDPASGVGIRKSDPISEWWVTGLQGDDENASIGVSTDRADYYLQVPHKDYEKLLLELHNKCALTKLVMNAVGTTYDEAMALDYEDLVAKVSNDAPQAGLPVFSAEELLRNAEFVINQIGTYEEAGDDDEMSIMQAPCLQHLISYAGLTGDYGNKDEQYKVERRRHVAAKREKKVKPVGEFSKATTTPLVNHVFRSFFLHQMKREEKKSVVGGDQEDSRKCGTCDPCMRKDCGLCNGCKSMAKFSGLDSRRKQSCIKRQCLTTSGNSDVQVIQEIAAKERSQRQTSARIEFSDKITSKRNAIYYERVLLNDNEFRVGDFVMVRPDMEGTAFFIAQILSLLDDREECAHVRYFCRGTDTVLGETADEKELFALDDCEDVQIFEFIRRVSVFYLPVPDNWYTIGGTEEAVSSIPRLNDEFSFWFRLKYERQCARFESLHYEEEFEKLLVGSRKGSCRLCNHHDESARESTPQYVSSDSFKLHGEVFRIGDAVFLRPDSYQMPGTAKSKSTKNSKAKAKVDESVYTEYFRHRNTGIKGSNQQTPPPFHIGLIEKIYFGEEEATTLKIRKLYRPENTHLDKTEAYDYNYVFWSDDFVAGEVNAECVEGKCFLWPRELLSCSTDEWFAGGRNRFYFERSYNRSTRSFEDLNPLVLDRYSSSSHCRSPKDGAHETVGRPLRTLDVFSGCGGLSLGLEQSGIAKSVWAIENFPPAAKAFKANHDDSVVVITTDCNRVLQDVLDGKQLNAEKQRIPLKGEVEMLVGGPPCQGYSLMNWFSDREYSAFKNSLVSTFLSYCEFYRPKFFILENVKNFASFKKSLVLKLCLRALTMMGYQCTFGVLQAGSYGVPQTRRRCILLAAAPDQVLPLYPEAEHVFANARSTLTVNVDERTFNTNCRWVNSAPFRTVTVRDALSDLPSISNGADRKVMPYESALPISHFQKLMRGTDNTMVRDHVCRDLNPLAEARMSLIPTEPGSDWRDLPNIEVDLKDGTRTECLLYRYRDHSHPASWPKRGICACASGKKAKCDPAYMIPKNTIIPWSLVHTSRRHNNWAGLYGRLEWDGFFSTTVTHPEPMGKQGRVLHPEQHRVVSVRECARSQGFPDFYQFAGDISDRHRQIGNAVPPSMALAIGREIAKALAQTRKQD